MQIRVQFYSHLRDLASAPELQIEMREDATVQDLLDQIYREKPALHAADKTILVAAGVEFVDRQYRLQGGEDISIMPPVQGG
jgi:molybdopterin converting factor small subunit